MNNQNRILLHACCGICSGDVIRQLKDLGYEPVVYFYNPNLDTIGEFNKRLEAQKTVCDYFKVEVITETYCPWEFTESVKGYEEEREGGKRCSICFKLRLFKSIYKAKELGIKYFTTSLVISPHKDFELISNIAEDIVSTVNNVEYVKINFKKQDGFLKTNILSKKLKLYRQNYCGCRYSKN